jgi:hypothetical protein
MKSTGTIKLHDWLRAAGLILSPDMNSYSGEIGLKGYAQYYGVPPPNGKMSGFTQFVKIKLCSMFAGTSAW